jgi:hypothetical protein
MEDKEDKRWQEGPTPGNPSYVAPKPEFYGYVPNYPKPLDTNPFNLVEGNENKTY